MIRLFRGAFSYQIFMVAEVRPSLENLLKLAVTESANRVNMIAHDDPVVSEHFRRPTASPAG